MLCASKTSAVVGLLEALDVEVSTDVSELGGGDGRARIDLVIVVDDAEISPRDAAEVIAGEGVAILFIDQRGDAGARTAALAAGCEDAMGPPLSSGEIEHRLAGLRRRLIEHEAMARTNNTLRELADKKRILASLVVHDLRNPLTAIAGNLQLVDEHLEDRDAVTGRALRDLRELAEHTLGLVASLLDVEELEEGMLTARVEDVDVSALLHKTSRHQRAVIEFRKLSLEVDVEADVRGRFDPTLVGRVIENLVDNAVRYAPSGGVVVVRAREHGGELVLRVMNSGPAIAVEKRELIFDRFYSVEARREGQRANRGLGLYFCQLAARAHRGTIAVVDGEADLPACFELRLPQP